MRWFYLNINPEPWAVGPVGTSRREGKMTAYVGRNQQLDAYKEAVKECLGDLLSEHDALYTGQFTLKFYFWRNIAEYTSPQQRTTRKHEADGTNLMKATEDALQGLLFANDKDVRRSTWEIVDQGPDVIPGVVIGIEPYVEVDLPETVIQLMDSAQQVLPFDDDSARWTPPTDDEVF